MTGSKRCVVPLVLLSLLASAVSACDSPLSVAGIQRVTPEGQQWSHVTGISWSPDGTTLALTWSFRRGVGLREGVPQSYLYLLDLESQEPRILSQTRTERVGEMYSPSWSPVSGQIAFFADWDPYGIWLVQNDSTRSPRFLGPGQDCTWSQDGERMAIANPGDGYVIYILNVRTGQIEEIFQISEEQYVHSGGISWSAEGNQVAFSADLEDQSATAMSIYSLDLASGATQLLVGGGHYRFPSWSPDGTMIAFSGGQNIREQTLHVLRVDDGAVIRPLDVTIEGPIAWSPDGSEIAFEWNGSVYAIDAATALREWATSGE